MGDGGYARIKHGLVQDLIKRHGEGAYTYALEKMATHEGDEFIAGIWRAVMKDLDEHFKQGEGQ
jgi:hypothetical protein